MASTAETSTKDETGNVENGPLNPKTTVEAEEGIEKATDSGNVASAEGTSAAAAAAPAAASQAAAKRFYLVRVPKPFANAELTKEVATLEAKCEAMRQNVKMTNEAIRFKKMKKQNARGSAALTPHPHLPRPTAASSATIESCPPARGRFVRIQRLLCPSERALELNSPRTTLLTPAFLPLA